VPITTAWRVLIADGGGGLQIWTVAANKFNKHS